MERQESVRQTHKRYVHTGNVNSYIMTNKLTLAEIVFHILGFSYTNPLLAKK